MLKCCISLFLSIICAWMKSNALWINWGLVKQNMFMFTNSQMLRTFRCPWILAHQQQEQHPVWSAALSVMSDNEKINHLLERASPLRMSLEVVELQWSIKRMLESTGGSALSVLSLCMWMETGNKILLHPGHATKESWDPATTQKLCWEKPISLLAMQEYVCWKGQLVNGVLTEVKRGSTITALQMVASLCFSQTLITMCEWGFSFLQSCSPTWIPGLE